MTRHHRTVTHIVDQLLQNILYTLLSSSRIYDRTYAYVPLIYFIKYVASLDNRLTKNENTTTKTCFFFNIYTLLVWCSGLARSLTQTHSLSPSLLAVPRSSRSFFFLRYLSNFLYLRTYTCNYCKTDFTLKRNLIKHQKNAQYCLDKQIQFNEIQKQHHGK